MLEIFAALSSRVSIGAIEIAILSLVVFFAALVFLAKK